MKFLKKFHAIFLALIILNIFLVHFQVVSSSVFCLLAIGIMLWGLIKEIFPPEITLVGTLLGILIGSQASELPFMTPSQAFNGLSNEGVLTVAALFIIAAAARNTGLFQWFANAMLGKANTDKQALWRMSLPIAFLSAFINNTPIVAIFVPVLREWAMKKGISPSKILIPLSYFTIFGGMCTLIGTSTNLVSNGLLLQSGFPSMGIFEIALIGVPCALIGILYVNVLGRRFLPDGKIHSAHPELSLKQYLIEMYVEENSRLDGLSVGKSGLLEMQDLFLFEVRRAGELFAPIKSEFILSKGDCLVFSGIRERILDLPKINGLTLPKVCESFEVGENARLVEVVISSSSPLVGKTLEGSLFQKKYDAAVLAIHRNGQPIRAKISRTPLLEGDTLLLVSSLGFRRLWQDSTEFYLVSPMRADMFKPRKAPYVVGIVGLMVLLPALNLVPILYTSLIAAFLLVVFRSLPSENVLRHVEWNVLLVIAAALGISLALTQSGASALLADFVEWISGVYGPMGALVFLCVATTILTEIITNNAAVALTFPIALIISDRLGVSHMPFVMGITVSASASFATPIGYQTNTMVYGPGGYKFVDFLRVGVPMNLLFLLATCIFAPKIWPF